MVNQPKKSTTSQQLLVEGKNDRHVIWALCEQYQLPETFTVEVPPGKTEGVESLLAALPALLDERKLKTLGIVVDADQDLAARWQSIRDRLITSGYPKADIPDSPRVEGWVYQPEDIYLKRVGVWVMPNNQLPGMLEDFVGLLMPEDDNLRPKAEDILREIEREGLNRYGEIHHAKALIHTWLAWQETPGMPMGQAITARVLRRESAIAQVFADWLQQLFEVEIPDSQG
ncbi:DUF3226 domain-containing protein [Oscillatoria acuminata]|uniref:DUF4435 domain-containing protein n=1 Tax=Oscillatoria acuminata PCC 6304 TaxID=56110 RepID=K9TNW4_9CYAN|nr:DUF3226 domain-containing protein [Oscillatoria acuminata]AFY84235.1 hypothetical protein Oscil6304_4724 [Oscillatoria acuminata PCC 6304]